MTERKNGGYHLRLEVQKEFFRRSGWSDSKSAKSVLEDLRDGRPISERELDFVLNWLSFFPFREDEEKNHE